MYEKNYKVKYSYFILKNNYIDVGYKKKNVKCNILIS